MYVEISDHFGGSKYTHARTYTQSLYTRTYSRRLLGGVDTKSIFMLVPLIEYPLLFPLPPLLVRTFPFASLLSPLVALTNPSPFLLYTKGKLKEWNPCSLKYLRFILPNYSSLHKPLSFIFFFPFFFSWAPPIWFKLLRRR